jgi:hypothetical protein
MVDWKSMEVTPPPWKRFSEEEASEASFKEFYELVEYGGARRYSEYELSERQCFSKRVWYDRPGGRPLTLKGLMQPALLAEWPLSSPLTDVDVKKNVRVKRL